MDNRQDNSGGVGVGSTRMGGSVAVTAREHELQKLLSEERLRSEQRKTNYSTLKEEHLKLQKDFLTLQSDMRQILSETKLIKDKKDHELDQLLKACEERDKTIDTLKAEIRDRDPQLIRQQFEDELKDPMRALQKSLEMVTRDKERIGYELKLAKQKVQYLEKESLEAVERQKLTFESEINLVKREKEELRNKLLETNQLPDVMKFADMTHENQRLSARVKSLQSTLEDAEQQYKKIESKVESLVGEHENSEREFEKQISALKLQLKNTSDTNVQLRQVIGANERDKLDLMADMERLKNEINRLNKQLDENTKQFNVEKDNIKSSYLKNVKDIDDQKDDISSQLKNLKAEIDSKNETIKRLEQENSAKDKEFQLKLTELRQQEFDKRCAIEHEKNLIQSKHKDLKEEKSKLKEEIQQMRRQIENMSELRLTVERDSMILRAKLESNQLSIEELDKLRKQHNHLHEMLNKLKGENAEYATLNKELIRQREQYRNDFQRVKETLDEERKQLDEFKIVSDKNVLKLRNCIDEERHEFRDQLLSLERDVLKCKKERDDLRTKYNKYVTIAEKLQTKLIEMKDKPKTTESSHYKSSQSMAPYVSANDHNQLKKELKSMKKRQNQIASQLLNCSFESTHCKELDNKRDD